MQYGGMIRILGLFLMAFSLTMLPPLGVAAFYKDGAWMAFSWSFLLTLAAGFLLWFPVRGHAPPLKIREGFFIIVLFWSVLTFFGSLPFMLTFIPHLSFTDAAFETMSGLTTTGATVLTDIDYLPHAIKLYHQQLQFFGGMAILVLAVAILPMLKVGGLQLYRRETPGPAKDTQLTPRIMQTAKALWYIYVGLTLLCFLAYWACGMKLFDAVGEAFSTVSTGGFSMHNDNFAHYHGHLIGSVAMIFMILGSTNFSLHFLALREKSLKHYFYDAEFRTFLLFLFLSACLTILTLLIAQVYEEPRTGIYKAIFNAVSIGTSTGFLSASFQSWPLFISVLFMLAGIVGGCAASTSGGIKVIRALILYGQGKRELKRLIHPHAVLPLTLNSRVLSDSLTQSVWGYVAVFFSVFILLVLILMGEGLPFDGAVGAVVACLANLGVGMGGVSDNFVSLNDSTKWVLTFSMLGGRLEIFTLLLLFTPAFWKK